MIELIIGVLGRLVWETVFGTVGYAILKCLTLGRYPKSVDPRDPDGPDLLILPLVGILGFVGLFFLGTWLARLLT